MQLLYCIHRQLPHNRVARTKSGSLWVPFFLPMTPTCSTVPVAQMCSCCRPDQTPPPPQQGRADRARRKWCRAQKEAKEGTKGIPPTPPPLYPAS